MREKQKLLFAVFGFIISLGVLGLILIYGMDFADLRIRWMSGEIMKEVSSQQYGKVYQRFVDDYGKTENQFIEEQSYILESLGSIDQYKLKSILHDKRGNIDITYQVDSKSHPNKEAKYIWKLAKKKNKWFIVEYSVRLMDGSEINVSDDNLDPLYSIQLQEAKELVQDTFEYIQDKQYQMIYKTCHTSLREKGSMEEFCKYLGEIENRYGRFNGINIVEHGLSRNGNEIRLDYEVDSERFGNKVKLVVWVKKEKELFLSGIKFIDKAW